MAKKKGGKMHRKGVKRGKKGKKAISKRKLCEMCGCHSGKRWEECCGRCTLPC